MEIFEQNPNFCAHFFKLWSPPLNTSTPGSKMRNQVILVPTSDKKYIALEFGVFIKMQLDKNNKERSEYENMRLLDSFCFKPSWLDQLTKNLTSEEFKLLEKHFNGWPERAVGKLKKKITFLTVNLNTSTNWKSPSFLRELSGPTVYNNLRLQKQSRNMSMH